MIERNYIYNTVSSGIGIWNSSNVTIDGNEVELACNDGEQECITVAGTRDFTVKNNLIHHGGPGTNGGEGIYLDSWDKHTHDIEVFENIVHDSAAGVSVASENGGSLNI